MVNEPSISKDIMDLMVNIKHDWLVGGNDT